MELHDEMDFDDDTEVRETVPCYIAYAWCGLCPFTIIDWKAMILNLELPTKHGNMTLRYDDKFFEAIIPLSSKTCLLQYNKKEYTLSGNKDVILYYIKGTSDYYKLRAKLDELLDTDIDKAISFWKHNGISLPDRSW